MAFITITDARIVISLRNKIILEKSYDSLTARITKADINSFSFEFSVPKELSYLPKDYFILQIHVYSQIWRNSTNIIKLNGIPITGTDTIIVRSGHIYVFLLKRKEYLVRLIQKLWRKRKCSCIC
ncbi:hypothetical protein TetV_389 [Tetraselmis virus 1]|uniref:Uncharacterized protein n=1 Tax=Tetraselmis virus 1 TaxID=2060617 RepID=A0A2P0VNK3_9VIRU|nr:hypothetical protein QJ968_gp389 [Tetraselmis virus 1]AUF82481.1 hypothetical protein TetV_389 [Tetraselmis virus 1]